MCTLLLNIRKVWCVCVDDSQWNVEIQCKTLEIQFANRFLNQSGLFVRSLARPAFVYLCNRKTGTHGRASEFKLTVKIISLRYHHSQNVWKLHFDRVIASTKRFLLFGVEWFRSEHEKKQTSLSWDSCILIACHWEFLG